MSSTENTKGTIDVPSKRVEHSPVVIDDRRLEKLNFIHKKLISLKLH